MNNTDNETSRQPQGFLNDLWKSFRKQRIRIMGVWLFIGLCLVGMYAPLFASSQPLVISWHGKLFFPWFRYLFYTGFYTKSVDLFFNLFMFIFLIGVVGFLSLPKKKWKWITLSCLFIQFVGFGFIRHGIIKDPARNDPQLRKAKAIQEAFFKNKDLFEEKKSVRPGIWEFELNHMTDYEKLQILIRRQNKLLQHAKVTRYAAVSKEIDIETVPTLWNTEKRNELDRIQRLQEEKEYLEASYQEIHRSWYELLSQYKPVAEYLELLHKQESTTTDPLEIERMKMEIQEYKNSHQELLQSVSHALQVKESYQRTIDALAMIKDKNAWIESELSQIAFTLRPLLSNFHWEEDAGGSQSFNKVIPWWDLTRINRKSLLPGLIFGIRVALIVGVSTIVLALMIGVPLGLISGYFSGRTDLVIFRFIEIWDTMPVFFMLLMLIAFCQNKSLFINIVVIGIFGWTGIARFIRAETLKQRLWPYVLASRSLGYSHVRVMISQVLPNAMIPTIAMLPFMIMTKIGTENTLSFLGLGEERSSSWGVLMHEAISVFPGESYLLWPPSIVLTSFLACIALIGDGLQDAYDPKSKN